MQGEERQGDGEGSRRGKRGCVGGETRNVDVVEAETEGVDPGTLDEVAWRKIETAYISVVPFMHLA